METTTDNIRFATDDDMKEIGRWLRSQKSMKNPPESLCTNWDFTKEYYRFEGKIIVHTDEKTNKPVAYMRENFGIVEVRNSHRKKGIGRKMVQFALEHSEKSGRTAIEIECAPKSSVPFWKKMGFTFYECPNRHGIFAYKPFNKKLNLTTTVALKIVLYEEGTDKVLKTFSQRAIKTCDHNIFLKKRIVIFRYAYSDNIDIGIIVDGKEIFKKCIYKASKTNIGVTGNGNNYYIEILDLHEYLDDQ